MSTEELSLSTMRPRSQTRSSNLQKTNPSTNDSAAREFIRDNFSLEKELEGNIEAYEKVKRNA
jgi:hypothetical protein